MTKHREILADFIRLVPQRAESGSKPDWTAAVKSAARELCNKYLGSRGDCHATIKGCSKEWLLDVLWYCKDEQGESVYLGLESEWTDQRDGIRYDFSRVLSTKAPIKIMFFETNRPEYVIEDLNDLGRTWLQHSEGDLVYAVDFSHGNHSTFFYRVRCNGRDSEFALAPVAELTSK